MNWARYIQRTAVRRVVWIVVGFAVYALFGWLSQAFAQEPCTQNNRCDRGTAYSQVQPPEQMSCVAGTENAQALGVVDYPSGSAGTPYVQFEWQCFYRSNGAPATPRWTSRMYYYGCPAGTEWREDLKLCFDPSECMARNQQEGFGVPTTRPWRDECIAGCKLAFDNSQGSVCTTLPNGSMSCAGSLQWTGEQCSVPPGAEPVEDAPPTRPDQATCTPAGSGQSFCIKPSGEQCYSASNGREVCWRPNETGEKSDRDVLQKRNPGPTEIPPSNQNLPTGDTLEKSGDSVTTDTTRTQGNTSTTTTTTTTNYQTQYGTNPGTGDQGAPADGSGGDEGGEGDSESGSVDGGGDCDSPPIVRGGDPVQAAVVNQTWATRCAVKAGNAAKVTGDVGDCKSPFTVEGDNANAVKLRAMREQICKEGERAENQGISDGLEGSINAMESEFTSIFGDGSGQGAGSISTTRYGGGGSCPAISIEIPWGGTWVPPPVFCDVIAALRLLFLAITTIVALRIIGS